jgi:TolB-like protein/lipoprotein NlpI
MKRCPECRRDYYDDTLLYCLDDGNALLDGPATASDGDEPVTAILSVPPAMAGGLTGATDETGVKTAILQPTATPSTPAFGHPSSGRRGVGGTDTARGFDIRLLFAPLAFTVIVLGGFFGYRYFSPAKQVESIAVMPFVNESGNPEVEYLSDGMTETLINSLSKLTNLSVKARNAVFTYKGKEVSARQIGQELGVQAVLYGRLVERGGNIKLNLELVNTTTLDVIWSEQYDRKQGDLVNLQQAIARDVSSKLRLKLTGADEQKLAKSYTTDSEAYRLYLQGRFYWNKRAGKEFEKSADYFRQAIEKDPNFALGYVGLADYYGDRDRDKAKDNVNLALALDDKLAEAHGTLGYQYMLDYDWARSEKHMTRALELDPKNLEVHRWIGQRLMMLGRYDESLASYRRALEIDPNSSPVHFIYGACLVASGQLEKGTEYLENAIRTDPTFVWNHSQLSFAYRFKGNYAGAAEQRAIAQELLGETENARLTRESFAKGGRDGFLREMIRQGVNPDGVTGGMRTASAYALLGDRDKALAVLEHGAEKGEFWLFQIKYDPAYEPLRGDPRFQTLLKKFDPPR